MRRKLFRSVTGTVIFFLALVHTIEAQLNIPLNDVNLHYDGSYYVQATPTLVTFDRHSSVVYNDPASGIYGSWIRQWVMTQPGIRIRFKTASPTVTFTFTQRAGAGTIGGTPTNGFTVFADSSYLTSFSSLTFTINNPTPGTAKFFEVVLPNLWGVDLTGMSIESGYSLLNADFPVTKPKLVTIGDSITHGTGQYVASTKGYAFLLAQEKGWDLYNFAVAGSTLGWSMALNLKGQTVDIVTILIGYNDWNYLSDPLSVKQDQYERLIDSIRSYQPQAKIYCITPLTTTDATGAAPYTLEEYRQMVSSVVQQRMATDAHLFLIPGPAISNASMLAPGDVVHLGEPGAAAFASNLSAAIDDPGSVTSVDAGALGHSSELKIIQLTNTRLELEVLKEGNYNIEIYSVEGRQLFSQESIYLSEGRTRIQWSGKGSAKGACCIVRIGNAERADSILQPITEFGD